MGHSRWCGFQARRAFGSCKLTVAVRGFLPDWLCSAQATDGATSQGDVEARVAQIAGLPGLGVMICLDRSLR